MKPKIYSQLHIQLIFAVKNREALLNEQIRDRVFNFMGGILSDLTHKPIIINGTTNHVHILFGLNPAKTISETVHNLKRGSSLFINREKLCLGKFSWQEGYGAFSYSKSQVNEVYNYIKNQEIHHMKKTFRDEYIRFLKNLDIEFQEKYLFDFLVDA